MTGRAAGYCAGYGAPGLANTVPERGFFGRGGGGGRGRRNWFYATGLTGWQRTEAGFPADGGSQPAVMGKEKELGMLKQQAEALQQQMEQLQDRLRQLETED